MAFDAIASAELDSKMPLTEDLMNKFKNRDDYLYGQSAGIPLILNGSFEIDSDADGVADNWTAQAYTGGTVGLETTSPMEGANSVKMVHPGGASNGGGYYQSDYFGVAGDVEAITVSFLHYATAAGMKNQVYLYWFDEGQSALTGGDEYDIIYNSTSNPTSVSLQRFQVTPPADARFAKVRLIGGYTDTDVAGTAYFDRVVVSADFALDTSHYLDLSVTQAKVAAAAICQSKLETSTQSNSTSSTTYISTALTGGEYMFQILHKRSSGSYSWLTMGQGSTIGEDQTTSSSYSVSFAIKATVSGLVYFQVRYVTASPPFDLGDGEAGLFIFALIEKVSGKIISIDICEEPPWSHNGPTLNQPEYWRDGKPYRKNIIVPDLIELKTPGFQPQYEEIEITQELKNADMDLLQSPFLNIKPDQQVIMFDPVSDLNHQLKEIYNLQHRDKLHSFIHAGDLLVDNTPLNRFGPKDIPIHAITIR